MRLSSTRAEPCATRCGLDICATVKRTWLPLRSALFLTRAGSASYAPALPRSSEMRPHDRRRGLDGVGNRSMPEAAREVGFIYGKYFLMKKLAAGGMGEIFLAKQQGPAGFQKILVAKKILSHLTENKKVIEPFPGEPRLPPQMTHRTMFPAY